MPAIASPATVPAIRPARPVIVGHRGAPSYRPEHTAASFELAVDLGADLIEPDVVVSRDGALIVRHDRELSLTTDVAKHRRFADRRTTKVIDGRLVTDWFVEDFDFHELRSLRAVERIPGVRPQNAAHDGSFGLLTLVEVLDLARRRSTPERTVGVLIELAPRLAGPGLQIASLVAAELRGRGLAGAGSGVVLQSFERAVLRQLRADLGDSGPPMVQLVDDGAEHDAMLWPAALRTTAEYAHAVGPSRDRLILRNRDQSLHRTTDLADRAHDAGLGIYVWTLCPENAFLPLEWRRGADPREHGSGADEVRTLCDMGVDALITDAPDIAVRALTQRVDAVAV